MKPYLQHGLMLAGFAFGSFLFIKSIDIDNPVTSTAGMLGGMLSTAGSIYLLFGAEKDEEIRHFKSLANQYQERLNEAQQEFEQELGKHQRINSNLNVQIQSLEAKLERVETDYGLLLERMDVPKNYLQLVEIVEDN